MERCWVLDTIAVLQYGVMLLACTQCSACDACMFYYVFMPINEQRLGVKRKVQGLGTVVMGLSVMCQIQIRGKWA